LRLPVEKIGQFAGCELTDIKGATGVPFSENDRIRPKFAGFAGKPHDFHTCC
jgi:hypothetical protein